MCATRTEYEHDEQRADAVHDLVPPHCADAPPHDAITDYELEIVLVSVTARRQPGWGETVHRTVPLIQSMKSKIMVPMPWSPTA